MSEEKQIEEMAGTMLEASTTANVEPVLEMEGKEVVLGENATKILNNILEQAYIPFLAEALYNAGYRKASEVAREIFEEIEEMLNIQAIIVCETRKTVVKADEPMLSYMAMLDGRIYSLRVVEEHIAELKKKYTEDTE